MQEKIRKKRNCDKTETARAKPPRSWKNDIIYILGEEKLFPRSLREGYSDGDENHATWPAGTPGRTRGELGLALPAPALANVSYLYCVCYSPLCMTTIRDRVGEAAREIA